MDKFERGFCDTKTVRAVIQRVSQASVTVEGVCVGAISKGLVIFLAVTHHDLRTDAEYLVDKATNLRVFADSNGKMNRSLLDIGGGVLAISQFTLYGNCRKGRRPSFEDAAPPDQAGPLYEYFVQQMKERTVAVATGIFQASMQVSLTNEGPVTFILDSKKV